MIIFGVPFASLGSQEGSATMRSLRIVTVILLGWAFGMPASGHSAENPATSPETPSVELPSQKPAQGASDMPVYKQPRRSIPKGRVGGGIRGGDAPALYVLVPDHVGLTKDEQPTLLWYLSKPTSLPLEFTLVDSRAIKPLLEKQLSPPAKPGVQRISLKDFGIKLEPNVQYKWFVTLVVGPESSSRDIVVGGTIERITFVEKLSLCQGMNGNTVNDLAGCGLWYDAIAMLSEMIEKAPDDRMLRKQRASLLQQVGLWEVARYDNQE